MRQKQKIQNPKYRAIATRLVGDIESSLYGVGDKLPSLRAVCLKESVSIITAKAAYRTLEREGYILARPKSGYFVADRREIQPPSAYEEVKTSPDLDKEVQLIEELCRRSFNGELLPIAAAVPSSTLLPLTTLRRVTSRVLKSHLESFSHYADPYGVKELREELARHYRRNGIRCSHDDVVIHGGAVEAITTTLRALTKPGDIVVLEKPTYYILFHAVAQLGLKVIPVTHVPGNGIDIEALSRVFKRTRIAAVIVIPNFHNPTGTLMSDENKEKLVALCAKFQSLLIEDDVYGELYFGAARPRPLLFFDRKHTVVHCSSVTKCLGPGLRVGWSISRLFKGAIERTRLFSQVSAPTLTQHIVAEFFHSEGFSRHRQKLSSVFRDQAPIYRAALAAALPEGTKISKPEGGFLLWVEVPGRVNTTELFRVGTSEGCSFAPGLIFGGGRSSERFFRISFGSPFTKEIGEAITRLGSLVHDKGLKLKK